MKSWIPTFAGTTGKTGEGGFETRPYDLKWQRSQDELVYDKGVPTYEVLDSRLRGNDGEVDLRE